MKGNNPSDYCIRPWGSVLQNSESETIALNVMVILKRTGDKFRLLDWEEYKLERQKDGNFSEREKKYFKNVVDFCDSPENAERFSSDWV